MRFHYLLLLILILPGCGRDWELPSFEVNPNCRQDSDCAIGVCTDGQCLHRCVDDDDCGPEMTCRPSAGLSYFTCAGIDGPAIVGDIHALAVLENLDAAFAFASQEHDDVNLILVTSYGLQADGTIDISESGTQLIYQFQAGLETPVTLLTVSYSAEFGTSLGAMTVAGGNPAVPTIAQQTWSRFLDSPELLVTFLAEPDCDSPQATQADVMSYGVSDGDAYFLIANQAGDNATGDPITGEFSYFGCSP